MSEPTSVHRYWDELAAGHALHGLSDEEEAAFAEHLATCERCAASLSDHELVAAQLGAIAHYREPGDDAGAPSWEQVRDAVVGTARPSDPDVADLGARRRRYQASRRVLAAAAAVVVVAGGGVAIWRAAGSGGGTGCRASAGCHVVELDAAAGPRMAAVIVEHERVVVQPTSNMPAAPAGKVYVLWQVPRAAQATPVSEFTARPGSAPETGVLRTAYAQTQQFAVSLESQAHVPSSPSNDLASGIAG
jgi:hypothetical protein